MHSSTLERIVIHARTIDIDEESLHFQEERDGDPGFCDDFLKLFTKGGCDVIGIQYSPYFAVSVKIADA